MSVGPQLVEPELISGRMGPHVPHRIRRDGDSVRIYCPKCELLWYFDSEGHCYEEKVVMTGEIDDNRRLAE